MKSILSAFGLILFGLLMGVGVMRYASTEQALRRQVSETAPRPERATDGRLALYLTADERGHVSAEMLQFLQGVQTISAAVSDEDRETIQATADNLRRGNGQGMGVQMKAPDGFRQIGQSLRQEFGSIADMSLTSDMTDIQQSLSDAMTNCVACHGTYTVVEVSE